MPEATTNTVANTETAKPVSPSNFTGNVETSTSTEAIKEPQYDEFGQEIFPDEEEIVEEKTPEEKHEEKSSTQKADEKEGKEQAKESDKVEKKESEIAKARERERAQAKALKELRNELERTKKQQELDAEYYKKLLLVKKDAEAEAEGEREEAGEDRDDLLSRLMGERESERGKPKKEETKLPEREKATTTLDKITEALVYTKEANAAAHTATYEAMKTRSMLPNSDISDFNSVVNEETYSFLIDGMAAEFTKEYKASDDEARAYVELQLWSKPNPYEVMYNLTKQFNPKFASKKEENATSSSSIEHGQRQPQRKAAPLSGGKPAPQAPPTTMNASGGSNTNVGWTAKRIDEMSEDELDSVPSEVYERYILGELD